MQNKTYSLTCTEEQFHDAVDIWINKPHILNRRLFGAQEVYSTEATYSSQFNFDNYFRELNSHNFESWEEVRDNVISTFEIGNKQDLQDSIDIRVHKLLSKSSNDEFAYQLSIFDEKNCKAYFTKLVSISTQLELCPDFFYSISKHGDQIILQAAVDDASNKTYEWLQTHLVPRIIKWSTDSPTNAPCKESLKLVSIEKYYSKYNILKEKYGKRMVEIWPEVTDPKKFVYEDIAIACYLLVLWEQQRDERKSAELQSFVDLGCGNGLLVYILSGEGHDGIGIDVRKRKIWDLYPSNVCLQEKTILPSAEYLFPNADWIIGNHSDELTPWIPVISAQSSYKCNFFLLPCCSYDFNGSKYQRKDSSKSQYLDYLDYIREICDTCGVKTEIDRLKIPSTKRTCLVGFGRKYEAAEYGEYVTKTSKFVSEKSKSAVSDVTDVWVSDFKPRSSTEAVRNCTKLDKTFIEIMIHLISAVLLENMNCDVKSEWNSGKETNLRDIASKIPKDMLKKLKSECGGLQTLIKNNHQVFEVRFGKVKFRYPSSVSEVRLRSKSRGKGMNVVLKRKPCWFYSNHPQKCPLSDEVCSFNHSPDKEN